MSLFALRTLEFLKHEICKQMLDSSMLNLDFFPLNSACGEKKETSDLWTQDTVNTERCTQVNSYT